MNEDKCLTICKECKHCTMNSHYAIVAGLTPRCGIETYIDPVYGECYKEEGLCRDKNKGDCPDYQPKLGKRRFLRKLFGGKS